MAVHLFDHISGTDAGYLGWAARLNRRDNDAFLIVGQTVTLEMFVRDVSDGQSPACLALFAAAALSDLVGQLSKCDGDGLFFPVPENGDLDLFSHRGTRHHGWQVVGFQNLFPFEVGNDIASLNPRLLCRPTLRDLSDQGADRLFQVKGFCQLCRDRLNSDTQPASRHFPRVFELVNDRLRHIDRNGKADTNIAAALTKDG